MKQFISILAVLLISAGFGPAASSLQAQGEYGQYSEPEAGPPPAPDQNQGPGPSQDQAQPQGDQSDSSAQPGVARASYVHGNVSSQRGDNSELVPLTVNTPLETGDRVSTAGNGRTEIELDYGDQLRLSSDATAKIATLNRQNIQIQLGQGLATYSALPGSQAQVEVDTPNAALHPDGEGDYRVLVNSDAETKIIVRSGSADVSTPEGSTHVNAGQMITVAGTDDPQYRIDSAPGRDDWDAWNADRDHRVETAKSFNNTDPYYTGSEDLDPYGEWSEVPDYGNVWFPNYGPDWAPYRDGTWVYEPYYGWTWVSYEPWGWAPYHYGRWFVYGGRWGWWPGQISVGYYPVWAPAYVSFFGWGGDDFSFGVGYGWGNVGWIPIGPCDWYHPWYGRWDRDYRAVGFRDYDRFHEGFGPLHGDRGRQFSNIHDALVSNRVRGGISSMRGNEFGHGRVPVSQQRVSEATFRQSSALTGHMPFSPSRGSYSATGRPANASAFRNAPPSSQHFFSANRGGFAGNARTQSSFAGNGNRSSSPAQNNRPGWRTFTPPSSVNRGGNAQSFGGNRGSFDSRSGANQGAMSRGGNSQGFDAGRGTIPNRPPVTNGANGQGRGATNGGWQHFTPPTQAQNERNFSRPNSAAPRGYQAPAAPRGGSNSYSRPPLNMRQPVVTPRGDQNYGNSQPRGGYYSQPPRARGYYSAPGGSYSAPRGNPGGGYADPRGGNYSAPRGGNPGGAYSAPRGNYSAPPAAGGGAYSAPRGNPGGGYSAPRGGGGGYSAPRGGGGGGYQGGGGVGGNHGGGGGGGRNGGGRR